jgi:hypothetical protein
LAAESINQAERKGGGRSDGNQSLSGVVYALWIQIPIKVEGAARKWQTQVKLGYPFFNIIK